MPSIACVTVVARARVRAFSIGACGARMAAVRACGALVDIFR